MWLWEARRGWLLLTHCFGVTRNIVARKGILQLFVLSYELLKTSHFSEPWRLLKWNYLVVLQLVWFLSKRGDGRSANACVCCRPFLPIKLQLSWCQHVGLSQNGHCKMCDTAIHKKNCCKIFCVVVDWFILKKRFRWLGHNCFQPSASILKSSSTHLYRFHVNHQLIAKSVYWRQLWVRFWLLKHQTLTSLL